MNAIIGALSHNIKILNLNSTNINHTTIDIIIKNFHSITKLYLQNVVLLTNKSFS